MSHTLKLVISSMMLTSLANAALHNANMLKNTANAAFPNDAFIMSQNRAGKVGEFKPCTPSDPPFTATWTPAMIKLGETLDVNFDMVPKVTLDKGSVDVTVWLPNYQDPIYQTTQDFSCTDIHKVFPALCPFKAGTEISFKDYKLYVKPSLPLPGGDYKIKAKVTNDQGQEFICLEGVLEIYSD